MGSFIPGRYILVGGLVDRCGTWLSIPPADTYLLGEQGKGYEHPCSWPNRTGSPQQMGKTRRFEEPVVTLRGWDNRTPRCRSARRMGDASVLAR